MPKISNSIKSGDFGEFDNTVKDASVAVCALTESAAQVSCNWCQNSAFLWISSFFSFFVSGHKFFSFLRPFHPSFTVYLTVGQNVSWENKITSWVSDIASFNCTPNTGTKNPLVCILEYGENVKAWIKCIRLPGSPFVSWLDCYRISARCISVGAWIVL